MNEQSTFFIKPEAASFEEIVIQVIGATELVIVEHRQVVITRPILEELYWRLILDADHQPLFEENVRQLEGKTVFAGIVEGQSAIFRLAAICGERTNPMSCNPSSLRFKIAKRLKLQPIKCGGKYQYWPNVIHRAKTIEEVHRDRRILFGKE